MAVVALVGTACSSDSSNVASTGDPSDALSAQQTPSADELRASLDADGQALLAELDAARATWRAEDRTDYAYVYNRDCDCTEPEPFGPNRVFVVGGEVTRVTHFGYLEPLDGFTAEDLFGQIEAAILAGQPIDVAYNGDSGFPDLVRLDVDSASGEAAFDLRTKSLTSYAHLARDLLEARQLWDSAVIDDYHLAYETVCRCPDRGASVDVRAGLAISHVFVEGSTAVDQEPLTVEALFAELDEAIKERADTITVEYDIALGYPTFYDIDHDGPADDRRKVAVTTLETVDP